MPGCHEEFVFCKEILLWGGPSGPAVHAQSSASDMLDRSSKRYYLTSSVCDLTIVPFGRFAKSF